MNPIANMSFEFGGCAQCSRICALAPPALPVANPWWAAARAAGAVLGGKTTYIAHVEHFHAACLQ